MFEPDQDKAENTDLGSIHIKKAGQKESGKDPNIYLHFHSTETEKACTAMHLDSFRFLSLVLPLNW